MLRLKGPSGNYATFVINDRGPFIKGRTLDIAKEAAGIVGILGRGVGTLCE
jgi:rare lipoprotein A